MANQNTGYTGWSRWLQSQFVLGWARRAYLVLASLSLVVALGALGFALFFELGSMAPASQETVPPPYTPSPLTIDPAAIYSSLQPPGNIRFIVTDHYVDQILHSNDSLGYFEADSENGLAAFPNDFDIMGGKDAALFDRVPVIVNEGGKEVRRAGLRPTTGLRKDIADAIAGKGVRRQYSLLVVARDRFGHVSRPAKVIFTIEYGPPPAQEPPAQVPPQLSALGQVARAIAVHLDPKKTAAYFDDFNRAMHVPRQCGTTANDANFVENFGRAFNQLKRRVTPSTVEAFYSGLCRAWRQAAANEAAKRQRAAAARNAVIQRNFAARAAAATARFAAGIARATALYVAAGAGVAFLFISLFLAFLAIENHSDALREAVQKLAEHRQE